MKNINDIYSIDENFKQEKKILIEKFEREVSEETASFLKKKKELLSELHKSSSSKPKKLSVKVDTTEAKNELEKTANKNKKKIEEFLKKQFS